MKLDYIAKNLQQLPIVSKTIDLYKEFRKLYPNSSNISTENVDPVKRFLEYVFQEKKKKEEKMDGEAVESEEVETDPEKINYLLANFYSLKGTYQVINLLYQYGILTGTSRVEYKSKKMLKVSLKEDYITDYTLYSTLLRDFFRELLYYSQLEIEIEEVVINIEIPLKNQGTFGIDSGFYQIKL